MKAIIRAIEKGSIKKGEDMGKPYYTLVCTVGPMHRLEEIKVVVIPSGAESTRKMVVDYYEGLIAKATADAATGQPANLCEMCLGVVFLCFGGRQIRLPLMMISLI